MENRQKRVYNTKSKKISRVKGYILLSAVFFSAGLILGERIYTEYTIDSLVPEVQAATHKEVVKELPMQEWVLQTVREAGIDPYKAYVVIQCESGWNSQLTNINKGGKLGIDRGLWQLSDKFQPQVSNSEAFDYKASTYAAIKIIKKQGWSPWVCAKSLKIR